jgi:hypothetical protein
VDRGGAAALAEKRSDLPELHLGEELAGELALEVDPPDPALVADPREISATVRSSQRWKSFTVRPGTHRAFGELTRPLKMFGAGDFRVTLVGA